MAGDQATISRPARLLTMMSVSLRWLSELEEDTSQPVICEERRSWLTVEWKTATEQLFSSFGFGSHYVEKM